MVRATQSQRERITAEDKRRAEAGRIRGTTNLSLDASIAANVLMRRLGCSWDELIEKSLMMMYRGQWGESWRACWRTRSFCPVPCMFQAMQPAAPWTSDRVAERLVMAFRMMPFHPVFSSGGHAEMIGRPGYTEVLAWPVRFVGDPQDRVVLMTWARCRASGESVRERYRAMGWARTKTEERRREALGAIAAGLNAAYRPGLQSAL